MRTLMALILGLGFAVAFTTADADAKSHKKNKQCTATNLLGQKSSFKCKAGETCCFDYGMNKGACKPKGEPCL